MISVLRTWQEIGEAHMLLGRRGLPRHQSVEKNWDLAHLCQVASELPRDAGIVDMGCGDLFALKLLHALGFRNLLGIDLAIGIRHRAIQLLHMWGSRTLRPPFRLARMDVTRTSLKDNLFDLAVCLSTIEHGVELSGFFREASRLIRRNGLLFLTTDYFEEAAGAVGARMFGLPWTVFDRGGVEAVLQAAKASGFELLDPSRADLTCGERCVVHAGTEYTFICIVLRYRGTA